jgi:hypothetical protein
MLYYLDALSACSLVACYGRCCTGASPDRFKHLGYFQAFWFAREGTTWQCARAWWTSFAGLELPMILAFPHLCRFLQGRTALCLHELPRTTLGIPLNMSVRHWWLPEECLAAPDFDVSNRREGEYPLHQVCCDRYDWMLQFLQQQRRRVAFGPRDSLTIPLCCYTDTLLHHPVLRNCRRITLVSSIDCRCMDALPKMMHTWLRVTRPDPVVTQVPAHIQTIRVQTFDPVAIHAPHADLELDGLRRVPPATVRHTWRQDLMRRDWVVWDYHARDEARLRDWCARRPVLPVHLRIYEYDPLPPDLHSRLEQYLHT